MHFVLVSIPSRPGLVRILRKESTSSAAAVRVAPCAQFGSGQRGRTESPVAFWIGETRSGSSSVGSRSKDVDPTPAVRVAGATPWWTSGALPASRDALRRHKQIVSSLTWRGSGKMPRHRSSAVRTEIAQFTLPCCSTLFAPPRLGSRRAGECPPASAVLGATSPRGPSAAWGMVSPRSTSSFTRAATWLGLLELFQALPSRASKSFRRPLPGSATGRGRCASLLVLPPHASALPSSQQESMRMRFAHRFGRRRPRRNAPVRPTAIYARHPRVEHSLRDQGWVWLKGFGRTPHHAGHPGRGSQNHSAAFCFP